MATVDEYADVIPTPEERRLGEMLADMVWQNLVPIFDRMNPESCDDE